MAKVLTSVTTETQVVSRAQRRRFTVEYKSAVEQEAEGCTARRDRGGGVARECTPAGRARPVRARDRDSRKVSSLLAALSPRSAWRDVMQAGPDRARPVHEPFGRQCSRGAGAGDRVSMGAPCGGRAAGCTAAAQVFAILLDEDTEMCSRRTRYRHLLTCHDVRELRAQRTHPLHAVPRLTATAPN